MNFVYIICQILQYLKNTYSLQRIVGSNKDERKEILMCFKREGFIIFCKEYKIAKRKIASTMARGAKAPTTNAGEAKR